MAKPRDMGEREFNDALARHGIEREGRVPFFGVMYKKGSTSIGGGSTGLNRTRRAELAYVLRRFEESEAEDARRKEERDLRLRIREAFANGITP